jgi:DNA topoisomerase III
VELRQEATRPPPRFTEATLLGTMENAGKLIEDEELAEAMSDRGLGTPATRASIIEGLISDVYVERVQRDLVVTAKGLTLIDQIADLKIDALTSPELTGQWEFQLRQMEANRLDRNTFMRDIRAMATGIVERAKDHAKALKERVYPELDATCAICGNRGFKQSDEFYGCKGTKCKVRVYKTVASRILSQDEARTLIERRIVGPLDGFRSRKGQEFSAALEIKEDQKVNFVFGAGSEGAEGFRPFDFSSAEPLCPCPVCAKKKGGKGQIYDTGDNYSCDVAAKEPKQCNAKLPKVLCKKDITPENALLFFTTGRSGLIEGMISKKGRPFSSYLLCKAGEKRLLGWEFPPRAPSAKKGAAKKAAAKTATRSAATEEGDAPW